MSVIRVIRIVFIFIIVSFSCFVFSGKQQIKTTTQSFSLKLGASRVIYEATSKGEVLNVENSQDYPILVQSKIFEEDKTSIAPFVVIPPLFRLEGNEKSRLRIINTGGSFVSDREKLYWLCVTGIAPKEDDVWVKDDKGNIPNALKNSAQVNIQLSLNNCIKLFLRPESLKNNQSNLASSIEWKKDNGGVIAYNPTPFYMNLSSVYIGGVKLDKIKHIPPFSSVKLAKPVSNSKEVEWKVINDYGDESVTYNGSLK